MLQYVAACCSVLQYVAISLMHISLMQSSLEPLLRLMGCVAVCCSVLQCVAVFFSMLLCAAVCCSVLHCFAMSPTHMSLTQSSLVLLRLRGCVAFFGSVSQCFAVCCNESNTLASDTMQSRAATRALAATQGLCCNAPHCTTLHHAAPRCTALQHTK